ncbi:MAG: hypothetical protein IPN33_26210 [Saprospiraceae bacterium]|nr:hypothetical protein [Saprospiraceae bacterium]
MSQTNYLLDRLNALNEYSVSVLDDCDLDIIPVFSVDTTYAEDCVEDGYFERRTCTWIATDACGNSDTPAISFDIIWMMSRPSLALA